MANCCNSQVGVRSVAPSQLARVWQDQAVQARVSQEFRKAKRCNLEFRKTKRCKMDGLSCCPNHIGSIRHPIHQRPTEHAPPHVCLIEMRKLLPLGRGRRRCKDGPGEAGPLRRSRQKLLKAISVDGDFCRLYSQIHRSFDS